AAAVALAGVSPTIAAVANKTAPAAASTLISLLKFDPFHPKVVKPATVVKKPVVTITNTRMTSGSKPVSITSVPARPVVFVPTAQARRSPFKPHKPHHPHKPPRNDRDFDIDT